MHHKLRRIAAICSLLIASMGIAVTPAEAFFYKNCILPQDNYHAFQWWQGGSQYDKFTAEIVYTRPTHTCAPFDGSGASLVLPVNLQQSTSGDGSAFVQLGYGRLSISDTADSFVWTGTPDVTGGTLIEAAWAETPAVGHGYELTAEYMPAGFWRYTVHDLTDGSFNYGSGVYTTRSYGKYLWSGFEVENANDQLGGAGIYITINNMRFQVKGENLDRWLQQDFFASTGTRYSYWTVAHGTDGNGRAYVRARTEDRP
jgi:hypothetical protein